MASGKPGAVHSGTGIEPLPSRNKARDGPVSAARSDNHRPVLRNRYVALDRRRRYGAVRLRYAWIGLRSGASLDQIAVAVAGVGDALGVGHSCDHRNGAGGDERCDRFLHDGSSRTAGNRSDLAGTASEVISGELHASTIPGRVLPCDCQERLIVRIFTKPDSIRLSSIFQRPSKINRIKTKIRKLIIVGFHGYLTSSRSRRAALSNIVAARPSRPRRSKRR
jgi:hypothetical protein